MVPHQNDLKHYKELTNKNSIFLLMFNHTYRIMSYVACCVSNFEYSIVTPVLWLLLFFLKRETQCQLASM